MRRSRAESTIPARDRQRGFALLIVLWGMVFLALIATHLTLTGRSEATIARNLADAATAEAAADGAVYQTIFHLLDYGGEHWPRAGRHRLAVGVAKIEVTTEPEEGKVNPNLAEPELLAAVFQAAGLDGGLAVRLGDAIVDWREPGDSPRGNGAKSAQYRAAGYAYGPPGEPFETIDELNRVLGMTPSAMTRIRPFLSLYTAAGPDPTIAPAEVQTALKRLNAPTDFEATPGIETVTVLADARLPSGARFERRAVVRLASGEAVGYAILEWERAVLP